MNTVSVSNAFCVTRSSDIRLELVTNKALNRRVWYGFLVVKFLLMVFGASATGIAADAAASKHRVLENRWSQGPWHGVSQMVLFDDRLWFINSNPYKDTNAADLYSLALNTGEVRYEPVSYTHLTLPTNREV